MSEQLTFIPASEAADMVGVSAQTIRNLCKAKTLRYQMRTNLFYVCREDVEKYAQSISEINQIERDIDDYKKEIVKKSEQLRDAKEEMDGRLADMNMFPEQIQNITFLLSSIIPRFVERLSDREVEVVLLILQGKTLTEVGEKVKLTRERTRQIWVKAVHKITCFPDDLQKKDKLIEDMSKKILELESRLNANGVNTMPYNNTQLLEKPVRDCNFSVRAMNCLMAAEIKTVGELIQYPRQKLLKFRGFGPSGLRELENWLTAHGLAFAN